MGLFADRRQRSRGRALSRQDGGYRAGGRRAAVAVPDDEWMSQFDTAERLGVSVHRVGIRLYGGLLEPAHNPAGQAGVTRSSLERELHWQRTASPWAKVLRIVGYALRGI